MDESNPLSRYLVPMRRWWWVIAGVVALGVLAAWITTPSPPGEPTAEEIADPSVTFRATHILMRNENATEQINFDLVLLLARQGDLVNRVLERMGDDVHTGDVDAVVLEADPAIGTISVTATQPTPTLASELATTYAEELQRTVDDRASGAVEDRVERAEARAADLEEEVRALEAEIADLPEDSVDRQLLEAELDGAVSDFAGAQNEARSLRDQMTDMEQQLETLQEPSPVSTAALDEGMLSLPASPVPRLGVAGLLALLAGGMLVLGIDYVDTRIRTRRDAEDAFGLPVIAQIPYRSRSDREGEPLPVVSDTAGATSEAFRSLRLSVQLAPTWRLSGHAPSGNGAVGSIAPVDREHDPRTLLVTSSLTGDGKSTLVANLAASYAEAGNRVLVVDCDFRRPAVGTLLGVGPGPGLRDLGVRRSDTLSDLVVPTVVERVSLVRSGIPGAAPPWFMSLSSVVVEQSRKLADVVLFDTGPLILTNEASALIPSVDSVLLVNRSNRLSRDRARDTVQQLSRLGAHVAGVVMIGADATRKYGYYEPKGKHSNRERRRSSGGLGAHTRSGRGEALRP